MEGFLFDLPDLRNAEFQRHNEESAALWQAFQDGAHPRIPIRFNTNPRMLMLDPRHNTRRLQYEEYMGDADIMAEAGLEHQYWRRFLLPGDHEKGLPEAWTLGIDFENCYDAAWFGCPMWQRPDQVPDTEPILNSDNKRMLFDRGIPDPFAGALAERALRFIEHCRTKCARGWTFLGRPVQPPDWAPFAGNDGLFTIASSLRGPTELCLDLLEDPEYVHELLRFILCAVTARMTAWRELLGKPGRQDGFCAADDSIQLLSQAQYREFVLPLHRQYYDTFATEKDRAIHLCGDAQRHFGVIRDELGVSAFDTGFPIDFAAFRRDLGPDTLICGGPKISYFLTDDPAPVLAETERILRSGVLEGGRFILQEGNNLPPGARLPVCQAFYEAGQRLGKLRRRAAGKERGMP